MKRLSAQLVMFAAIIGVVGCGGSRNLITTAPTPQDEEKKETGIVNEFFDPLILDEEDLKVKKTISLETKSDQITEETTLSNPESQKSEIVPGFRVQICALSDEGRAKEIQREALLKFINEEVYLIYDSPYYKVRIGNCPTRYDADRLQQLAVEKGFDDAWVVRTKIILKSKDF